MTLMLVLVNLVLGFVCANIAEGKGRGRGSWFLLGLLFGPFSLIVLLLLPKDDLGLGHIKCPYCAEFVKKEAVVCKHCGRDLERNHDVDDTMRCTRCGHDNPVSATQCEACKYRFVV